MDLWGPVLALVGVLAASGFAFYQWRHTELMRSRAAYQNDRAATLQDLVNRLQELQVVSRRRTVTQESLDQQVQLLNIYLIRNRTMLQEDEERGARDYLDALIEIHRTILTTPRATREAIEITAADLPRTADGSNTALVFQRMRYAELFLIRRLKEVRGVR